MTCLQFCMRNDFNEHAHVQTVDMTSLVAGFVGLSNHILSSFINQAWGDVFPLINGNRLKSNLSSTSLSSQLTNHDPKSLLLFYMII